MTTARPAPDVLFDDRGVMARYWLDPQQWAEAQAVQRKSVPLLLAFGGMGCLLSGLAFLLPPALRVPAALFVSVDVFYVMHLARGLLRVRQALRPLSAAEARALSARLRRFAPGLLRSLDAWMQSGIPLLDMDAQILRSLLVSLRQSAHFEDAATQGFAPGQTIVPTQREPFAETDRTIVLPWERGPESVAH